MRKKRWLSLVLCGAMVLSLLSGVSFAAQVSNTGALPAAGFPDVGTHWAAASIGRWSEAGIVHGDDHGNYNPNSPMSRAEFATVLNNLMGYTETARNTFADVKSSDWYADAILKLSAAGVMQGDGVNANPRASITRQEAFVMLCRALKITPKAAGSSTGFADDASVASWARGAVAVMAEMGIANGVGNNQFAPTVNINRASMAALLDKSIAVYANQDGQRITGSVDGIVIIAANDVTFQDAQVTGTVLLAPAMGNRASVTLAGSTSVKSLTADVENLSLTVEKNASVNDLTLAASGVSLTVKGRAAKVTVAASGTTVNVAEGGKITTLTANQAVKVQNNGSITTLEANASRVVVDGKKPQQVKVASGVDAPTDSKGNELTGRPASSGSGSGSSGSGSGSGSSTRTISGVDVRINGVYTVGDDAAVLKVGDKLTAEVSPAGATYSAKWQVGGTEKGTGSSYTVTNLDVGQRIQVEVTGTGRYSGTKTSALSKAVIAVTKPGDIYSVNPDTAPVVLTKKEETHFVDTNGQKVTIPDDATLTLNVAKTENVTASEEDSQRIITSIVSQVKDENGNTVQGVTPPEDIVTVAVDVDLTMTQTVDDETTETKIHPVGETVVTLTRENLGLSADINLNEYVFSASHVNAVGETQSVEGKVVNVNGQDCVRFTLNGLSRIWIGNVPPRTVTFDTDGGSEVPAQKVKFGGYAKLVDAPTKAGWLFAGWDHDLQTENIITNVVCKAIWVKGTPAADSQLTHQWTQNGAALTAAPENVTVGTANGVVTLTLDPEASYAANLGYTVTVAKPAGAVKAITGPTAEAVAASTADKATDAPVTLAMSVTSAESKPLSDSKILYIKWLKEDGTALDLQSVRVTVKSGGTVIQGYDTKVEVETVQVDRGIGTYEFYLTSGKGEDGTALPDYVGAINGYLGTKHSSTDDTVTDYLRVYASFLRSFSYDTDSSTGEWTEVDAHSYTGVKVVVTPFAGQSFTTAPTVTGHYNDNSSGKTVRTDVTPTVTMDGNKAVVTCAKPATHISQLYLDLTYNGVTQQVSLDFPGVETAADREEWQNYETWAETLAALNAGVYHKITYTGQEAVVLTSAVTLSPYTSLDISRADFTIGNGGVLTLEGDDNNAAHLSVNSGIFTVAGGGKLATKTQPETQNRFYQNSVWGYKGAVVEDGGVVEVPVRSSLGLSVSNGDLTIAEGGTLNIQGGMSLWGNEETSETYLSGTANISGGGHLNAEGGLTITATGKVTGADSGYFDVYGGLTVKSGGTITLEGNTNGYFSGHTVNEGTISAGSLDMFNLGYSVINRGTINITNNGSLYTRGTVVVNTGSITGSGTIWTERERSTSQYENGIEYVERADTSIRPTPDNYDHYKFVTDPATTVELLTFIGELSNQDGGTCTLTLEK